MSDSIKRLYGTPLYKGAVELFGHVEEATDEITSLTARVKELEKTQSKIKNLIHLLTCIGNLPEFAHYYGTQLHEAIDAAITEKQNDQS